MRLPFFIKNLSYLAHSGYVSDVSDVGVSHAAPTSAAGAPAPFDRPLAPYPPAICKTHISLVA